MPGGGASGFSRRGRFCACWAMGGMGNDSGMEMPLPGIPRLFDREEVELRSFDTGNIGTPFICEPEPMRPWLPRRLI